jgi:hypothetical protein
MPASARPPKVVHVHGGEVSTESETLGGYAEILALLLAIAAFLVASWIAMEPRPDADLQIPAPPAPETVTFVRAPDSTRDVIEPNVDATESTAVTTVNPEFTIVDE